MGKRIVIALGGNALGQNLPEQMLAVKETSKAIADLVEAGHGGGGPRQRPPGGHDPECLRRLLQAGAVRRCDAPVHVRGMSQGYIGYDLQTP